MDKKEMIKLLTGLRDMHIEVRGMSFDYRKGVNDAQWTYHTQINNIIKAPENENTT